MQDARGEITCLNLQQTGESGLTVSRGNVFCFPTHTHVYYEMTLYEPFDGGVTVNQYDIAMDRHSVVLVTPSDFHRIRAAEDCDAGFIKVAFDEEILLPAVKARLSAPMLLRDGVPDSLSWHLFHELLSAQVQEDAVVLVNAAIVTLLQHGESLEQGRGERIQAWVLRAVSSMNQRFSENIALTDIAAELSVSPQYLSQIFSRTMGVSFREYLSGLRLRRAAELLRESDLRVTEVCYQCGYRNLSHFLRSFKRRYGVSPLRYRAGQGNENDRLSR